MNDAVGKEAPSWLCIESRNFTVKSASYLRRPDNGEETRAAEREQKEVEERQRGKI